MQSRGRGKIEHQIGMDVVAVMQREWAIDNGISHFKI